MMTTQERVFQVSGLAVIIIKFCVALRFNHHVAAILICKLVALETPIKVKIKLIIVTVKIKLIIVTMMIIIRINKKITEIMTA
jgi:hypothetical protein